MMDLYVLDANGDPVEADILEFDAFMRSDRRYIARTEIGDVLVSTVFLGINCCFAHDGPPVLFETKVVGGPLNNETERYCTLQEAKAGHEQWVERVRNSG